MSVSIDAEKRCQTWRESGVSSQGVMGWAKMARNGSAWGAVDTGLAFSSANCHGIADGSSLALQLSYAKNYEKYKYLNIQ